MAFPQGSVGLPFLKSCRPRPYTSDISSILTATSVCGHLYVDDRRSVLYLHGLAFGATAAVRSMSQTSGTRRPESQRSVYRSTRLEPNSSGLELGSSLQS